MDSFKENEFADAAFAGDSVVTPITGHPAANNRAASGAALSYGVQPGCSTHVEQLADTLHATLAGCEPHAYAAAGKASLRGYLCEPALLSSEQRAGNPDTYTRHLLYAAPDSSFSILAIVWRPGQLTPIHGHTAWGTVGVYTGSPYCEIFDASPNTRQQMHLRPTMKLRLKAGDLATVQPGIDDVHRLGNDGGTECITIHIYGRDLLAHPGSINITFS